MEVEEPAPTDTNEPEQPAETAAEPTTDEPPVEPAPEQPAAAEEVKTDPSPAKPAATTPTTAEPTITESDGTVFTLKKALKSAVEKSLYTCPVCNKDLQMKSLGTHVNSKTHKNKMV
jgi:hypothetical protein